MCLPPTSFLPASRPSGPLPHHPSPLLQVVTLSRSQNLEHQHSGCELQLSMVRLPDDAYSGSLAARPGMFLYQFDAAAGVAAFEPRWTATSEQGVDVLLGPSDPVDGPVVRREVSFRGVIALLTAPTPPPSEASPPPPTASRRLLGEEADGGAGEADGHLAPTIRLYSLSGRRRLSSARPFNVDYGKLAKGTLGEAFDWKDAAANVAVDKMATALKDYSKQQYGCDCDNLSSSLCDDSTGLGEAVKWGCLGISEYKGPYLLVVLLYFLDEDVASSAVKLLSVCSTEACCSHGSLARRHCRTCGRCSVHCWRCSPGGARLASGFGDSVRRWVVGGACVWGCIWEGGPAPHQLAIEVSACWPFESQACLLGVAVIGASCTVEPVVTAGTCVAVLGATGRRCESLTPPAQVPALSSPPPPLEVPVPDPSSDNCCARRTSYHHRVDCTNGCGQACPNAGVESPCCCITITGMYFGGYCACVCYEGHPEISCRDTCSWNPFPPGLTPPCPEANAA